MSHNDDIPEPTEDMEHFVHMHIDFHREATHDGAGEVADLGVVHMHVHGVPMQSFVETLLALAVQITTNAMMGANEGPFSVVPDSPEKVMMMERMAREFLAARMKTTETKAMVSTAVPDDASELFAEGS